MHCNYAKLDSQSDPIFFLKFMFLVLNFTEEIVKRKRIEYPISKLPK